MPAMDAAPQKAKSPARVAAGRRSARKRWGYGPPKILRLDTLTPEEQAVVHSLLRLKAAREASSDPA